jgi:hypothetical protein
MVMLAQEPAFAPEMEQQCRLTASWMLARRSPERVNHPPSSDLGATRGVNQGKSGSKVRGSAEIKVDQAGSRLANVECRIQSAESVESSRGESRSVKVLLNKTHGMRQRTEMTKETERGLKLPVFSDIFVNFRLFLQK